VANVIKLSTVVSYAFSHETRAFVPCKHLQPSLMFVGKARSLFKSGAPEWSFTWVDSGLTHKQSIRLERLARDKCYKLIIKRCNLRP
jgi:hypothetical protein